MSTSRRRVLLVAAVAACASTLAACFCGDACDTPDPLVQGAYRAETERLVFNNDAGTVLLTRTASDGGVVGERWRVVGRGATQGPGLTARDGGTD